MKNLNQSSSQVAAEQLLIDIHNLGIGDEPDAIDIASELKDFETEALEIVKRNVSLLQRLINKEYTRRNK